MDDIVLGTQRCAILSLAALEPHVIMLCNSLYVLYLWVYCSHKQNKEAQSSLQVCLSSRRTAPCLIFAMPVCPNQQSIAQPSRLLCSCTPLSNFRACQATLLRSISKAPGTAQPSLLPSMAASHVSLGISAVFTVSFCVPLSSRRTVRTFSPIPCRISGRLSRAPVCNPQLTHNDCSSDVVHRHEGCQRFRQAALAAFGRALGSHTKTVSFNQIRVQFLYAS